MRSTDKCSSELQPDWKVTESHGLICTWQWIHKEGRVCTEDYTSTQKTTARTSAHCCGHTNAENITLWDGKSECQRWTSIPFHAAAVQSDHNLQLVTHRHTLLQIRVCVCVQAKPSMQARPHTCDGKIFCVMKRKPAHACLHSWFTAIRIHQFSDVVERVFMVL